MVTGCCDPREFDAVFTDRYARRTARRFENAGLDVTARGMVEFLAGQGLRDTTILEIGGGVGGLHIELLRRGAAAATNVEISTAYETQAERLLANSGFSGSVVRRIVDIAADPTSVASADAVVLHRVVCCYPNHSLLLGAAADKARHMLAFSYPRPHVLSRAQTAVENLGYSIRGQQFRTFVHSSEAMARVLAERGFEVVDSGRNLMWEWVGALRSSGR